MSLDPPATRPQRATEEDEQKEAEKANQNKDTGDRVVHSLARAQETGAR